MDNNAKRLADENEQLRAQTAIYRDAMETLAKAFAPVTSGAVGLRIGEIERQATAREKRIAECERKIAELNDSIERARESFGKLRRVIDKHEANQPVEPRPHQVTPKSP